MTRKALVIVHKLNCRVAPDLKADQVCQFDEGTKLEVVEEEGEWLKVRLEQDEKLEKVSGYVHATYLSILSDTDAADSEDAETEKKIIDYLGNGGVGERVQFIEEDTDPPEDLESFLGVAANGNKYTLRLKKDALRSFIDELKKPAAEAGIYLHATSGFRTYARQKKLYDSRGGDAVEAPGYSEHHLGTTVDITMLERESEAFLYLLENAAAVGWIPTQYFTPTTQTIEPWHWRYVGVDAAAKYREKYAEKYEEEITELKQLQGEGKLAKNTNLA